MGEAFHSIVAAGNELLRVHTHPFRPVHVGEQVVLELTRDSCSGLAAAPDSPAGTPMAKAEILPPLVGEGCAGLARRSRA